LFFSVDSNDSHFSSLLGQVGFGLLSALLLKHTRLRHDSRLDIIILLVFGYASYLVATYLELSGLFAIFFCGIIMGHYTYYNMSAYGQLTSVRLCFLFSPLPH
jgi:NhaP-type Na+/H+ or K+/H+ antiporter